jgi:hypothetical protein
MFLSLIVNYKTKTDCELAIAVEAEEEVTTKIKWKLKGWKLAKEESKVQRVDNQRVFVIKCDVSYEQDDWFVKQVEVVEKGIRRVPVHNYNDNQYKGSNYGYGYGSFRQEEFEWNKAYKAAAKADEKTEGKNALSNATWSGRAYQIMLANAPDLFTLGLGHTMTVKEALDKTNMAVDGKDSFQYKKALAYYFSNEWFAKAFGHAPDIEEEDALGALAVLLSYHKEIWVVRIINSTLDELRAYYSKAVLHKV